MSGTPGAVVKPDRRGGGRSVLATFAFTYLAVLILLFAVTVLVEFVAARAVEKGLERANSALFSQLAQSMDAAIEPGIKLIEQIGLDPGLRRILYQGPPLGADHYYEVTQLVAEFGARQAVAARIDQVYVYLRASDRLISSTTHAEPDVFYGSALRYRELTYDQWLDLLRQPHPRTFLSLTLTAENGKQRTVIACVQSLPLENYADAAATVVVSEDAGSIRGMTQGLPWLEGGEVLILQKDDSVVFSTSAVGAQPFRFADLASGGYRRERVAGKNVVVFSARSVAPELIYVAVVPLGVFLGQLYPVYRLMIAAMIAYVLVGAAFLLFSLRRYYRPLRDLVAMLGLGHRAVPAAQGNEYLFITNAVRAILGEKEALERRLEAQNAVVRDEMLVRLLRGETTWETAAGGAPGAVADVLTAPYAVLLFAVSEVPRFAGADLRASWPSILTSIITSVVPAPGPGAPHCPAVALGDRIAVLASLPRTSGVDHQAAITALVEHARRDLARGHGLECVVAASAAHARPAELSAAYGEACWAEQHRFLRETEHAFLYTPVDRATDGSYEYPAEAEAALADQVKVCNAAGAADLVDSILEKNLGARSLSLEKARCLISDLAGTIVKTIDSMGRSGEPADTGESSFLMQLNGCPTLTETRAVFHGFLEQACSALRERHRDAALSTGVERHVRKNFMDPNMNVNTIALRFGLTPAYVSRRFREDTGMRLLDFVCGVRLAEARRVLAESGGTISEVAARVGFSGAPALIRAFKKREGITPGQLKRGIPSPAQTQPRLTP